jgi:hypothetical protein
VTKIDRFPGEYHRPPKAAVELYPAFDETLTTELDATVRNLKVLRERSHGSEESERWKIKAFEDLQAEVLALRKAIASIVKELNRKASLANQGKFESTLAERMDKRIDTIRNVACWAIGILVVIMGLIKVVH